MIQSRFILVPLLFAVFVGVVEALSCNATTPCPTSAPCCSEFGFCGTTSSFCLGGCNPFASATLDSCRPEPVCKNAMFTFADQSRILSNSTLFDGNSSEYDFVVNQGNIQPSNGDLAMTLTQANGGTRLSSTRYVHYGTISAKIKAGRWAGVVTAFITMSDIKDEIDWELVGQNTTQGQSNFFWQGNIPSATQGDQHGGLTDTFSNYHNYSLNWQPDALTFSIDGKVVRTVQKSETVDASGVAHYPSTPSRVQLSIWPAGISSSPPGTVQWSGGMINWNDPDYISAGHFYALVNSVSIQCADTSLPPNVTSYVYSGNRSSTSPTILTTNESTLLNGAERMLSPFTGSLRSVFLTLILGLVFCVNALLL